MPATIQILTLPENSTFDQPTTTAGRQWKTGIGYLFTCQPSCFSVLWGRHHDSSEVTVLIDWSRTSHAQSFLTTHYAPFAALLEPLLAVPPDLPSATDLDAAWFEPAGSPGAAGVTTISKLTYSSMSADQRGQLLNPLSFDYYVQVLGAASREGDERVEDCWLGGDAAWAVDGAGSKTTTMWMLMSWKNLEAEQRCENTFQFEDGRNVKEVYLGSLLRGADPGGKTYHVSWELLDKNVIDWWINSENTRWPYQPLKDENEDSSDL